MPTIFFHGPKMEKEKKRELVKAFTASAAELTGLSEKAFVVYIDEVEADNVGVGGELLSDRRV